MIYLFCLVKLWGYLWFVILLYFLVYELDRHFRRDPKIKEIEVINTRDLELEKTKKGNINTYFGLDKGTFVVMAVNMIIIVLTLLSLSEISNQNKETADANIKIFQILQEILNKQLFN